MEEQTITDQREGDDAGYMLAPLGDDGPNLTQLIAAFSDTVREAQTYVAQCQTNYRTRFALWAGQSSDGKKHARDQNGVEAVPWEGASDMQVFMVDDVINYKVAQNCMALRKANFVATPIEGNDLARANTVSAFLKWLIRTQIPNLDREEELLENYKLQKGLALTGQFWEVCQQKTLLTLRVEDFQKQNPTMDLQAMLSDPLMTDVIASWLTEQYDISTSRAKKVIRSLIKDGKANIPIVGKEYSRPVILAFNLDEDIFIPTWATNIESAPWVFRVHYHTAEQLRSLVNTDDWDSKWVEAAISKLKGKWISMAPDRNLEPLQRNNIARYDNVNELIGVVYCYQTLSDEDGIPGKFLTIFNPNMPEDTDQRGYAKFGLLNYAHGEYPFVLHRREYLSRRVHDSRGVPEQGKPAQDQVKSFTDARNDASAMAILPPLMHPLGRPPGKWGPNARVPERRQGEYHYADRPAYDVTTTVAEDKLMERFRQSNGIRTPDGDPIEATTKNQFESDKTLRGWAAAYRQVWKLWKQFGPEEVMFRVMGVKKQDPIQMERGDPNEDYDIVLTFDVQSADPELWQKKLEAMAKVAATFDKNGQFDYGQGLQIAMELIDPTWAERTIKPEDASIQEAMAEEKTALTKIYGGFEEDIDLRAPPQIGLQVIQQWVQSEDIANRLQQDEAFKKRVEKRFKQYSFQIEQQKNAQIGRYGA